MPTAHVHARVTTLHEGSVLAGRFRIIRILGKGSIGVVWLVEDMQLENERLACKVLRENLRDHRAMVADLKREVLLARKLRHPNILSLHTFWETPDAQFVTMEFIEGKSLAEALSGRRAPFTLTEVLPWVRDLAGALDYAHTQGVLHRDVKPANVLLADDGRVYLADFGIARLVRESEPASERACGSAGTVHFMSPEQLIGGASDPRSDLYSLAASAYLLLSGLPPFHEGDVLSQIQMKPAAPVAMLSETVNRELLRALSKSPATRHRNCAEFYEALRAAADVSGAELHVDFRKRRTWQDDAPTVVLGNFNVETRRTRLGRLLVERGLITQEQLAEALMEQRQTGKKLGAVLIRQGLLTETALANALGQQLSISTTRLTEGEIDPKVASAFPRESAERHLALPMKRTRFGVVVGMADPLDTEALNRLEEIFGEAIEPLITTESDVRAAIARIHGAASH